MPQQRKGVADFLRDEKGGLHAYTKASGQSYGRHKAQVSNRSFIGRLTRVGIVDLFHKLDYRLNARPEIKKPEDLRGKRIAISGPGSTSHLVTLLALQGLNTDAAQARIRLLTIPGTRMTRG